MYSEMLYFPDSVKKSHRVTPDVQFTDDVNKLSLNEKN
jgi:hypothetical protein